MLVAKYSKVWGVVKVDLTKHLRTYVVALVEWIGDFKIDVDYHTLPNACFFAAKEVIWSEPMKI